MVTTPSSAAARKGCARAIFLILPPLNLNCRARNFRSTSTASGVASGQIPPQMRGRLSSSGRQSEYRKGIRRTKGIVRFRRRLVARMVIRYVLFHLLQKGMISRYSHTGHGRPYLRNVCRTGRPPHQRGIALAFSPAKIRSRFFPFPDIFAHHTGQVDLVKVESKLVGDDSGGHGFAVPDGPEKRAFTPLPIDSFRPSPLVQHTVAVCYPLAHFPQLGHGILRQPNLIPSVAGIYFRNQFLQFMSGLSPCCGKNIFDRRLNVAAVLIACCPCGGVPTGQSFWRTPQRTLFDTVSAWEAAGDNISSLSSIDMFFCREGCFPSICAAGRNPRW